MAVPQERRTWKNARALAGAGYRVFPILPFSKEPATTHGFKDATNDLDQIDAWFNNDRGLNLAVACGLQPNGVWLFAVDVDPKNGGPATWAELCAAHGTPLAPRHETPSGGFHLFFDGPGLGSNQNTLGPGVDTRGEGGYVVVPPSTLTNGDGEVIRYRTSADRALAENVPPPVLDWIRVGAELEPPPPRSTRQSVMTESSPADLLRARWDWFVELPLDGWQQERSSGGDVHWVRPGKLLREGKSATLHPSGAFVIWTAERPKGGVATAGSGVGATFSPYDYVVAYRFGGDHKAAVRWIFEVEGLGRRATAPAPTAALDRAGETAQLYPPREWYDQRPWMAACRQMAEAVGGSPSAHLLAFLTRWATLIPPGFSIPPINGSDSNFGLIGMIAGVSGAGKTSPMSNARKMLPFVRKDIVEVPGLGSGEGILERFYGVINTLDDDGKKRQVRGRTVFGAHFAISEGLIFAELSQRAGTNHATRLCDAWSGAPLSTPNASAETYRLVDAGQYQLTAMLGIQADRAHELMTDSLQSQGFVGRVTFVWTEEPRVKPRPAWPDPIVLPVPPAITMPGIAERPWPLFQPVYLEYPQSIWTECQDRSDALVGTDTPPEDRHHDLMRLKVAGIAALMDGRMFVNGDDWSIATTLVDLSRLVRLHLYDIRRSARRAERHAAAVARAETELVIDDIKERQGVASMAENIKRTVKEPWAEGALRKKVSSTKTRHRFVPALELAVTNCWVVRRDGKVEPA